MSVGAVLTGIGAGISIFGQYKASKAESASLIRQAQYDEMRATEILERNEINNGLLFEQSQKQMGSTLARSSSSIDNVFVLEEIARNATRQMEFNERDAQFEAYMTRLGAGERRAEAEDVKKAFPLQAAGTAVSAGGSMAKNRGAN